MERLNGSAVERLQREATAFSSSNHFRYLSEALECTRATGNPVKALALLAGMWGTAYARRAEEKKALDDVGAWLEQRLHREPGAEAPRIMLEIAWVRRLTRIAEANAEQERRASRDKNEGRERLRETSVDRQREEPRFGKRIESIQKRRTEIEQKHPIDRRADRAPSVSSSDVLPPAAGPPVAPPPTQLPATFEAEFVDFADARQAFQAAKDREKRKKPPKERLLPVRPVDARLRSLAADLVCSTSLQGFKTLFNAVTNQGGSPRGFHARSIEERDGKRIIGEILLDNPSTEASR